MSTIIAGRFEVQDSANDTVEELLRAGFARDQVSTFYVNPAGQHGAFPIGGDRDDSPGATEVPKGAAAGAAAGAVIGVVATPLLGPVGTITGGLLGAHVGGLVGSLSQTHERGDVGKHGEDAGNAAPLPIREAGMLVAVAVSGQEQHDRAVNVLRAMGAGDIEQAEGTITAGDWVDFDPVAPPALVDYTPGQPLPSGPHQRM